MLHCFFNARILQSESLQREIQFEQRRSQIQFDIGVFNLDPLHSTANILHDNPAQTADPLFVHHVQTPGVGEIDSSEIIKLKLISCNNVR